MRKISAIERAASEGMSPLDLVLFCGKSGQQSGEVDGDLSDVFTAATAELAELRRFVEEASKMPHTYSGFSVSNAAGSYPLCEATCRTCRAIALLQGKP